MADAMALPAPSGPDVVAALRAVAPSRGQALAAAATWAAAQTLGWDGARLLRTTRTWYRHLDLLHRAGFPVPLRPYGDKRPAAGTNCTTLADLYALVGDRFVVTDPWEPAFYPEGTTGHVSALFFRNGRWLFELAYDGSPGGHEHVGIGRFLHRCAVAEGGSDAS